MIVKQHSRILSLVVVTLALFVFIVFPLSAHAATKYTPTPTCYEADEKTGFKIADENAVSDFCFGNQMMGEFSIRGSFRNTTSFNGYDTYCATGEIVFDYVYKSDFQINVKEEWNLKKCSAKSINDIPIKSRNHKGVLIVQTSKTGNGSDWETVFEQKNIYDKNSSSLLNFYAASESELRSGTYYRILLAYELQRKIDKTKYEKRECLEVYQFYLSYSENPVVLRDLYTREDMSDSKIFSDGFIIDKGGSNFQVTLTKKGQDEQVVDDMTTVSESGSYLISIVSELGDSYHYAAVITKGTESEIIQPEVYEGSKYVEGELNKGLASFGENSLTSLKVMQYAGNQIKTTSHDSYTAFGFAGSSAALFLHLHSPNNSEWHFNPDTWGKKKNETISGVKTGTVNTGAIIIQKSADGNNWTNVEQELFANGISTTDYSKYYADQGDILIYTPDGQELLNGLYLKVTFAYQLVSNNGKTKTRYMEVYPLYLCSNNLDAVTFHNLSVNDTIDIYNGSAVNAEVFKKAETLRSGSCTVSGFEIDTSLNPTVQCTVYRDGNEISIPDDRKLKDEGKYEIKLLSAVGDEKSLTIYVDRQSPYQALQTYFGEEFLTGKRVYSEGDFPVYEGGLTSYNVNAPQSQYLPIIGKIINESTKTEIKIDGNKAITGKLTEAGKYTATFTTQQKDSIGALPGDYRAFTFQFRIIKQGTAPGPVINQKSLEEYAKTNISDAYPKYYGLTYSSATKGYITAAYATKGAAKQAAISYEKGLVEQQPDGSYRYKSVHQMDQKAIYYNNWELQEAIEHFAELAIHEHYFDLSDEFTCLTLRDNLIGQTDNLKEKKLSQSVTLFATKGEKRKLCSTEALPLISPKPYFYLSEGTEGKVYHGYNNFRFVRDRYHLDSEEVMIRDSNGKEYPINYRTNVGEELEKQGCPSGIITIVEKNKYNESASYQAVFIRKDENTAKTTLSFQKDDKNQTQVFTQNNNQDPSGLIVQSFSISSVEDELDPYTLIRIKHNNTEEYYVADELPEQTYSESGEYRISIINRLGYKYSIELMIQ